MLTLIRQYFGLPVPPPEHRHEWGPWSTFKEAERKIFMRSGDTRPHRIEFVITQVRECTTCKLKEYDQEVLEH